jgi:hypothetical protein
VDPCTGRGAGILIKENSIKDIEINRESGKAQLTKLKSVTKLLGKYFAKRRSPASFRLAKKFDEINPWRQSY